MNNLKFMICLKKHRMLNISNAIRVITFRTAPTFDVKGQVEAIIV